MSNVKLSGKGLVIQIDKYQIQAVKTVLGAAKPQVLAAQSLLLPAGAVEDGVIRQPETVAERLKTLLAAPELKGTRRAVFCLCSSQIITERVSVPRQSDAKLEKMLKNNMDLYFPVDTSEYSLVWQNLGASSQEGEMDLQLWAVPKALLQRYYALAGDCNLAVAAIDYFGHSAATAAGATYAQAAGKKRKKSSEVETAETWAADSARSGGSTLYLTAENEHLVLTFTEGERVALQRTVQRSSDWSADMSEALMSMEYYASTGGAFARPAGVLCGTFSQDPELRAVAEETLGIPFRTSELGRWDLAGGAARTTLDFGDPAMAPASRGISKGWQYGLILIGGGALAAAVLLTMVSRLNWSSETSTLQNQANALQLEYAQKLQDANRYTEYAQNYDAYTVQYDSYSRDWDTVFNNLHTYNDNLSLVLQELEDVLPASTTVKEIGIGDEGVSLVLSSPNKLEAAYVIVALRDLEYASLLEIADLGDAENHTTAAEMLPSLAEAEAMREQDSYDALMAALTAAAAGSQTTEAADDAEAPAVEAPPTEGDNNSFGQVLDSLSGASDAQIEAYKAQWNNMAYLERVVAVNLLKSTLEEEYGVTGNYDNFYNSMLQGFPEPQKMSDAAIEDMIGLLMEINSSPNIPESSKQGLNNLLGFDPEDPAKMATFLSQFTPDQQQLILRILYSGNGSGNGGNQGGNQGGTQEPDPNQLQQDDDEATAALRSALGNLTPQQLIALAQRYSVTGEEEVPEDLWTTVSWYKRSTAVKRMLTESPDALRRLLEDIQKQMKGPSGSTLAEILYAALGDDQEKLQKALESDADTIDFQEDLVKALTQNNTAYDVVELILRSDEDLSKQAAYYIALDGEKADGDVGKLDYEKLLGDLRTRAESGTYAEEKDYSVTLSDPITPAETRTLMNTYISRTLDSTDRVLDALLETLGGRNQSGGGNETPVDPDPNTGGYFSEEFIRQMLEYYQQIRDQNQGGNQGGSTGGNQGGSTGGNTGGGTTTTPTNDDQRNALIQALLGDNNNGTGAGTGGTTAVPAGATAADPQYEIPAELLEQLLSLEDGSGDIYLTVCLGYKSALGQEEQARKGLDQDAKVSRYEMEAAE